MRKIYLILIIGIYCYSSNAQYTISKGDGGDVITELGLNQYSTKNLDINAGSSLRRTFLVLNSQDCPILLGSNVGLILTKPASVLFLLPTGNISEVKSEIAAIEIHYILYNVFDNHLSSFRQSIVNDINGAFSLDKSGEWRLESDDILVKEFLTCVAYVAYVRTKEGLIWRFNPLKVKEELDKMNLLYGPTFIPNN